MVLQRRTEKAAMLARALMLLLSLSRRATTVAAFLLALALITLVLRAEKPAAPPIVRDDDAGGGCRRTAFLGLAVWRGPGCFRAAGLPPSPRPRSHTTVPSPAGNPCPPSSAPARTCCRVPSTVGNLCLLDVPSCGPHGSPCASRSGGAGLEQLLLHRMTAAPMPDHGDPPEGTTLQLHPGSDEFTKFTDSHRTELIKAIDAMKVENKRNMEKIKSEMEKITSGLTQHAGEFRGLKNEVLRQGTIQRFVICSALIVAMVLGFLIWMFHDEWMNRAGSLAKVWAGEALYEFTGGWFGKKVS